MLSLELSPATVIVALVVLALATLAVRRLMRNGTCDCHKDAPRGKKNGSAEEAGSGAAASCASGCGGCAGCSAAASMAANLEATAHKQ